MCNRKHQSEKSVQAWLELHGISLEPDWTDKPRPGQIFPTGKKTPRYGLTVRRQQTGNKPLIGAAMEWGFPTWVPSARDPAVKLLKYVTNARNLKSPFWRSSLANPANRCLVPFTHFAEPHPEGGKGDDGLPKQAWFCLPDQPVSVFAGFWRSTDRGPAYAFATCKPNEIVAPIHPKAMPAILKPDEWDTWLEGPAAEAEALVRPYDGPMDVQITTPQLSDGGALDLLAEPQAGTMTPERELWACALEVQKRHGDRAAQFVAERIGALALAGDVAGIERWKAIAGCMTELDRSVAQLV